MSDNIVVVLRLLGRSGSVHRWGSKGLRVKVASGRYLLFIALIVGGTGLKARPLL